MIDDVKRHLLPGETILWQGRPPTGIILRPIEIVLIPFSLLWAGFAVFWNVNVWAIESDSSGLFFKLFGLPFLIAGFYITIGRFLHDMYVRRTMEYLVTDRRVLIVKGSRHSSTKSVDIKRLPALEFDEQADGTGTIRFDVSANWMTGRNFGIWQQTFDQTPQFFRINDARAVYELIQKNAT